MVEDSNRWYDLVRHTLGCTCPDSLLAQIRSQNVGDGIALGLDVGGRLLVHVATPAPADILLQRLTHWLVQGRAMRDAGTYNRFRLVLACDDPQWCERLQIAFASWLGQQERLHLHLLTAAQVHDVLLGNTHSGANHGVVSPVSS